jgi:SAM-dependent methyltransferase
MAVATLIRRARRYGPSVARGRVNLGWCPICEARTAFVDRGGAERSGYLCLRCESIPRWRALVHVLSSTCPEWRAARIHESSPSGPASAKLRSEAPGYSASYHLASVPGGSTVDGRRSEDLERLTFADSAFDLFITQDVFEHLFDPAAAFREIARVLRVGGSHVFTVPWWPDKPTIVRARRTSEGVEHLLRPRYHSDPIDPEGTLVVRQWGRDLVEFIHDACGLATEVHDPQDRRLGLAGRFQQVFVTRRTA